MLSVRVHSFRYLPVFALLVFVFSWGILSRNASGAETLIAPGATWNYNDTGTDLATVWREISYGDSGWSAGPAQLGYGDGDEATVISYGSDANNKYRCYYFRHGFSVADPTAYESLTLRVVRDDGCVVYLNGTEVVRSNMPPGEITYGTWASAAVGEPDENAWHDFSVAANLLVAGTNVVAVEVHQANATSTDVSFDLELVGNSPPPPVPSVTLVSPADQSVVNSTSVSFTCSATDAIALVSATLYVGTQPQTLTFSGWAQTDDSQLSADQPNTNFGSQTTINVDGLTPHAHGAIKFPNVFGSGAGQVPSGSNIVKATLGINCVNSGNAMKLYRLTEDWVEEEVTWNQRSTGVWWADPGADGSGSHADVAMDADCSTTGWRTFDITSFVQEWSSGAPNYGTVLMDTGTDGVDFDSSESANPPVLTVSYRTDWVPVETKTLSGTSDAASFTTTLTDQQDYVWNCLVTNTYGQQSWAQADFRLRVDTHVPNQPTLVGPADGVTGVSTSPVLEVTVSDPDGEALNVTFYGRAASGGKEFTIIALPDTQKYSFSYPEIFTAQTQWVVNNAPTRNIVFVSQEGDIVDTWNDTVQWQRANTSMSLLDDIVPYGLAPGNHDQPTDYFNVYFPYTRYEGKTWYGGHYPSNLNDSNYELFSAGGDNYIVVHLVFWPGNDVISWADSVLKAHADRKAIITTHGFINETGQRNVHVIGSTEYIWDGLVVPNDNVYFVLCGHVGAEYARTDVVNGREVHQLLADYQGRGSGGDGWLRIMRFVPAEDKVYVQTYTPWLNQYETDANSQFTLNFAMGGFSVIGTDTGVPSGSNAWMVWSDLSLNTQYEWYVTVTDPTTRKQTGPVWHFTTASDDTFPPTISGVDAVDITDTAARIVWTTDELADSLVDYGLDTSYGSQAYDAGLVLSHSILLTGLSPETPYHYRVTSKDGAGNSAQSRDYTFTTLPLNRAPAARDVASSGDEDGTLVVAAPGVLANDSDPDLDSLEAVLVGGAANGALVLNGDGSFTYTPEANFNGPDGFTYEATDGRLNSNVAIVKITVKAVNDAPVAVNDAYSVDQDGVLNVCAPGVLGNDSDVDSSSLTAVLVSAPSNGTLSLNGDGSFTYTPNAGYSGADSFTCRAYDGTVNSNDALVSITVKPVDYDAYVSQNPTVTYGTLGGNGIAGTTTAGDGLVQTITEVPNGASAASLQAEYVLHTTADRTRITTLELRLSAAWTAYDVNDSLLVFIWQGTGWQEITADIKDGSFTPSNPQACVNADGNIRVLFKDSAAIRREKKDTLTIDLLYARVLVGPPDSTPPAVPTGLSAMAGDGKVDLDWNDNAESDLKGYYVYRSTTVDGTYSPLMGEPTAASSYQDTGVTNGTTYYYKVSSVDLSGNESARSGAVGATPVDLPPSAPTGLVATAGNGQVALDWNDSPEGDIAGYNVYRSTTQGGPYGLVGSSVGSGYVDSAIVNGTTYYYVVTAVDAVGQESNPSNEASATPSAQQTVHVQNIEMRLEKAGTNLKAVATVLIHDNSGTPKAGATVVGNWRFNGNLIQTDASGTTDGTGNAAIASPPKRAKSGDTFTFVVTNVVLSGYTYAPAENVETQDSISVP